MSDLQKLIEAVGRGEEVKWADFIRHIGIQNAKLAGSAHYGSLDAAKALHEALLPGWMMPNVAPQNTEEGHAFIIQLFHLRERLSSEAYGTCFARAWLLAILHAYAAQQVAA